MINYIDFYFEAAKKKATKTKTPKSTKASLTDIQKINLFFNSASGEGGKWKQIEKDPQIVLHKKSGENQQPVKVRIDFFSKLYLKIKKDNPILGDKITLTPLEQAIKGHTEIDKELLRVSDIMST
jgi:hypothetical protein